MTEALELSTFMCGIQDLDGDLQRLDMGDWAGEEGTVAHVSPYPLQLLVFGILNTIVKCFGNFACNFFLLITHLYIFGLFWLSVVFGFQICLAAKKLFKKIIILAHYNFLGTLILDSS